MPTVMSRFSSLAVRWSLIAVAVASTAIVGASRGRATAPRDAVRFSSLTPAEFEAILDGHSDVVVEFRVGDVLPLEMRSAGDLLVTDRPATVDLKVADTFFLRADDDDVELSRDGVTFLPFKEAVSGRLNASAVASSDGRVSGLRLDLSADFPRP